MKPRDASGLQTDFPKAWKYRVLVGVAVASPVVVGGGVAVLVAHALTHSWLWGLVGLGGVAAAFGAVVYVTARWSRRNPEAVQAYMEAFGRAQAGFPLRSFPEKRSVGPENERDQT